MTKLSDADLATFVSVSAVVLDLRLDDEARAAVIAAMRGLMVQATLVLGRPKLPAIHPAALPIAP